MFKLQKINWLFNWIIPKHTRSIYHCALVRCSFCLFIHSFIYPIVCCSVRPSLLIVSLTTEHWFKSVIYIGISANWKQTITTIMNNSRGRDSVRRSSLEIGTHSITIDKQIGHTWCVITSARNDTKKNMCKPEIISSLPTPDSRRSLKWFINIIVWTTLAISLWFV